MPEPHVVMGQRNQRDSCPQLAGLTPLTLPARPLAEMPRLTSPSPQMPAEAACSEPTLLAPTHTFPIFSYSTQTCAFPGCQDHLSGKCRWGGREGRPDWKAQGLQRLLCSLHTHCQAWVCAEGWCPSPKAGNSEVLQGSPCTGWGISPRLRNEDSIPLSSQFCWFPLALPSYVATLSCYIDTKCLS